MNYESIILEMLARIQTLESEYATIKTRLDEICAGKATPCEVTEKENAVASARNETEDKGKISTNDIGDIGERRSQCARAGQSLSHGVQRNAEMHERWG